MSLHTDYRPKSFDEMLGNKSTIASLKAIYSRESDWPHAVLLQGPKGCGKTTLARIIADLLECKGNDFVEINSSNDRGIGTARSIQDGSRFKPVMSKSRVYLLDEVHMTTPDFQNAMLKPLEDAPAHAYFLLCTTDPSKLIPALRSRCHTFEVQYLTEREIIVLLKNVLREEKADISIEILKKISEASDGCPRDALKILDQVIDMEPGEMAEAIVSFAYSDKQVVDLYNGLMKRDPWKRIFSVLAKIDLSNPETPRRAMIGLAAATMMRGQEDVRAAFVYEAFKEPFYNNGKAGFIFATYRALVDLSDKENVPF
ncbi:MAG: AAA family ATPase [Desulfobacterales bacterium]|nr:AAA family ATPase [Desulfobacterales bacterium]